MRSEPGLPGERTATERANDAPHPCPIRNARHVKRSSDTVFGSDSISECRQDETRLAIKPIAANGPHLQRGSRLRSATTTSTRTETGGREERGRTESGFFTAGRSDLVGVARFEGFVFCTLREEHGTCQHRRVAMLRRFEPNRPQMIRLPVACTQQLSSRNDTCEALAGSSP